MDEVLAKVAKVQELLPKLKDPARIAKAEAFLRSHGIGEPKSGFIGSGAGNQQEGLAGIEDQLPAEKVTATMPEHPDLAGEVASSLGSAAIGFDNGAFAGIPHRAIARAADIDAAVKAAELTGGDTLAAYTQKPSSDPQFEGASDMMDRVEQQDPLSSAAGAIASLGVGGLPALFEGAASRILSAIGMKAAPKSAMLANAVRKGISSATAGVASGATEDAARALDEGDRHPEVPRDPMSDRLVTEAEKLAIQGLLSGGAGALAGAMGARAAANRDPSTNPGSGGIAQKLVRLEEAGGGIGATGIKIPETLKPAYSRAMSGGQKIPKVGEADVMPEGATPELAELFKARPAEVTQPALSVEETVISNALPKLQAGIAKADRYAGSTAQQMNDAFYATDTAKNARVIPKNLAKKTIEFIKTRTFKDQSPVAYTNSGEPINQLNKMFTVGDPVSSSEAANAIRRNPDSSRMTVSEARASGFRVPEGRLPGGEEGWVVIEPKPMSVQQYEEMVDGVQAAAKVANVKGDADKMHSEFLKAAMEDRKQVPWPPELGAEPAIHRSPDGKSPTRTITGWAAVQLKKHELLKELETDLFNLGTDRVQATNETTGAQALRGALGNLGEPGTGLAERAASKHMVNEPGGREALNDVLATNYIEGNSGLRKATELSSLNPFTWASGHNRRAFGLATDPLLRAAGRAPTVAGAAAPGAEALQPYLQQLLQGISARMGR